MTNDEALMPKEVRRPNGESTLVIDSSFVLGHSSL
jgi:hypothetical protein